MVEYKFFKSYSEDVVIHNKKSYENNIFTFDIETSSYLNYKGSIIPACEYKKYKEEDLEYFSSMYIWVFGINKTVYYGRTWEEFSDFLKAFDSVNPKVNKIVYVHNLAFEFQFLKSHIKVKNVFARKSRKVIGFDLEEYNISFRCSLYLTNASLEYLPNLYGLKIKKQVGFLDYDLLRNQYTELTDKELKYCEYDSLVLYEVINFFKKQYIEVFNIPKTSTGIVRKEFKEEVKGNKQYYNKIKKAYNKSPHIYNFLVKAFAGGYTHANYIYADEIIEDVSSFDESSAYPFHMVTFMFPSTEFKKCYINKIEDMVSNFAYLVKVKLKNVKSRYYNHVLSYSHCYDMYNVICDNGRIISADELTFYGTEIDLKLYLDCYECEYEILESYYSLYRFLPIELVKFILKKYKNKVVLKSIDEVKGMLEKNKFNSIYGMCVTNTIRSEVLYDDSFGWNERQLTNEEIETKLNKEFFYSFLSFSWGVWITSRSRNTLIRQIIANDDYLIYSDTDSLKLKSGFDQKYIDDYNKNVIEKIKDVCKQRGLKFSDFSVLDAKGKKHTLGLFEYEGTYDKFKTLGAKKYCVEKNGVVELTVSGIPKKSGSKCLKDINEFKKGKVFSAEITGKKVAMYNDEIPAHTLKDFQGNEAEVSAGSGVTIIGADYTLGITNEYEDLIQSSERSLYNE